jgi:uncharacterized protein
VLLCSSLDDRSFHVVMRQPMPAIQLSRRGRLALAVAGALIVFLIVMLSLVGVYTNWLWFGSVGYRGVYSTILRTRLILFAIFGVLMAAVLVGNVVLAYRLRPPFRPMSTEQQNLERYRVAVEPRRKLGLAVLAGVALLSAGSSAQGNWQAWVLWLDGVKFHVTDPQFHRDISFFAFDYPVYRIVIGFLFAATIFSLLLSAGVYYLYGAVRLQTPGPKITISARRHLTVLVFVFMLLKAVSYWLDRYGLVYSNEGKVTGASYTDVHASLPARTFLFYIAVIIAIGVLASIWLSSPLLPAIAFAAMLIISIIVGGIYPTLVQQIEVKPNAAQKEAKYISRNIQATRQAYGIETTSGGTGTVTYKNYSGTPTIDPSQLTDPQYANTVGNIRLLDPDVVSPTFTQVQRLKNQYAFNSRLDIDRYTLKGVTKDYIVGVRELDASTLTGNQTNWINEHSFYTHGYGFVAAPADSEKVNAAKDFTARNIPQAGDLKITQPRVYFGELGVNYSIVGGKDGSEYDGTSQTTTYTGKGGVSLGNVFTRAAYALKYGQLNFLLNDTARAKGARIIYDRDPRQRVLKVAPFLKVDNDPYPAVVNGHIVWILDGYTTMSNYPYSEKEQLGNLTANSDTAAGQTANQADTTFNYIRNSVKATVDAYTGAVHLYQWDQTDPLLKAWMKIFPKTILPKSAIPSDVLAHIRYPQNLFEVQRELLARYHVTNPIQFYNVQNQWTVPSNPYQEGDQPPYYVLAASPTNPSQVEYQLTSPMRVNSSDNLAAYISVNSQAGPDYGKITVLTLPPGATTLGPKQVANQFKSTPVITQQVTLFAQGDSAVDYGNLLSLPVAGGFLYVEPLYVKSSGASQPILERVIVYFSNTATGSGNQIGYGDTLAHALTNLSQASIGLGIQQGISGTTTGPTTTSSSSAPTPTTAPTSTPAPTTAPPPTTPGTHLTVPQILAQLDAASKRLDAAYKTGSPIKIAQAQADLKKYADLYLKSRSATAPPPTATKTR